MRVWKLFATVPLVMLVTPGCGSRDSKVPDPVPVKGTVTLDGKPLANATVHFRPEGENMGSGSVGTTDANGNYELTTRHRGTSKKGAVPGKYRVYFSQLVGPDGKTVPADSDTPPAELAAREVLAPKFSDPTQSQETAEVGESGGTINFTLSTKAGRASGGLMPR